MASSTTLNEGELEFYKKEIDRLELRNQELTSQLRSTKPPVDGLLKDFCSLGLKLFQVEPKEGFTPIAPIITNVLTNPSLILQQLSLSCHDEKLVPINPKTNEPGPDSKGIDMIVKETFTRHNKHEGRATYLRGNFGPVKAETPPTSKIVIEGGGSIPRDFEGMILRNGPNPQFDPEGSYNWLDGESMVHGVRFKNGEVTYVARYTQTARYKQQEKFEKAHVIKYGDLVGEYGLFATFVEEFRRRLHIIDPSYGITTANVSLVYHARRIMALDDFGLPHVVYVDKQDGDLKTTGINNYGGKLDHWLTPHPKIDPKSGDMFTFGSLREPPYCKHRVITKEGVINDAISISVTGPTFMHDLSITENYVIFQELPMVYDPKKMEVEENEWIFHYDDIKKPRYGILKRGDKNDDNIVWHEFEDSSFVSFHNVNAWEEDEDTIVIYCCNMMAQNDKNCKPYIAPATFQRYDLPENSDFEPTRPNLYKMTFDVSRDKKKDKPKNIKISDIVCDFPVINKKFVGRKNQYAYTSEFNKANKALSIVKFDLTQDDGNPKKYIFGTDKFGGEVVYVPKIHCCTSEDEDDTTDDEDDGYLITFVHHEISHHPGKSYVYVIDAKTMELVVKLLLPSRVPYGFHALYVTEEQIHDQIVDDDDPCA